MAKFLSLQSLTAVELIQSTNSDFSKPELRPVLTGYDTNGHFIHSEIESIEFKTGLLKTTTGEFIFVQDVETLDDVAKKINIVDNESTLSDRLGITEYPQIETIDVSDLPISIASTNHTISVENGDSTKQYQIVNIYYEIEKDREDHFLEKQINAKREEIESLRESTALAESVKERRINDLETQIAHATDILNKNGETPVEYVKSTSISILAYDTESDRYVFIDMPELTTEKLKQAFPYSLSDSAGVDDDKLKALEALQQSLAIKDKEETFENFSSYIPQAFDLRNVYITDDGKLSATFPDNTTKEIELASLDATKTKTGFFITYNDEDYFIASTASSKMTFNSLYSAIADSKDVENIANKTEGRKGHRLIIPSEFDGIIEVSTVWSQDGKTPTKTYTIQGQTFTAEELKQNNIYASEENGLIAIREKKGDSFTTQTRIIHSASISTISESTKSCEISPDDPTKVIINGQIESPDFIDYKNKLANINGTFYQFESVPQEIGGVTPTELAPYINTDTNKVNEFISIHGKQANNALDLWTLEVNGKNIILSVQTGENTFSQVGVLEKISLDGNGNLVARLDNMTNVYLATPSNAVSEHSLYKNINKENISLALAISASPKGISEIIERFDNSKSSSITNPEQIYRNLPDACFVTVRLPDSEKDVLMYKMRDVLYGKNDETLSYSDNRLNITSAFIPDAVTSQTLKELALREDVFIDKANGQYTVYQRDIDDSFIPNDKISTFSVLHEFETSFAKDYAGEVDVAAEETTHADLSSFK